MSTKLPMHIFKQYVSHDQQEVQLLQRNCAMLCITWKLYSSSFNLKID